jgi:hypothetical protein
MASFTFSLLCVNPSEINIAKKKKFTALFIVKCSIGYSYSVCLFTDSQDLSNNFAREGFEPCKIFLATQQVSNQPFVTTQPLPFLYFYCI